MVLGHGNLTFPFCSLFLLEEDTFPRLDHFKSTWRMSSLLALEPDGPGFQFHLIPHIRSAWCLIAAVYLMSPAPPRPPLLPLCSDFGTYFTRETVRMSIYPEVTISSLGFVPMHFAFPLVATDQLFMFLSKIIFKVIALQSGNHPGFPNSFLFSSLDNLTN